MGTIPEPETTTTQELVNENDTNPRPPEQPILPTGNNVGGNGEVVGDSTTTTTSEPEDTSDARADTSTTTTLSPRQRAADLMQNKPFGKMTPEEKQLVHDEGLV